MKTTMQLSTLIFITVLNFLFSKVLSGQITTNQFHPQWAKCVGSSNSYYEEINSAILHTNGYIYAVGSTVVGDQQDFFISKIDPNDGQQIFYSKINFSLASDILHGISETPDGSIIAVGIIGGNSDLFPDIQYKGNGDIAVVKFDNSNGQIISIKSIGGSGVDRAYSTTCLPNGDILIAGKTSSSDFDFTNSTFFGNEDAIILKLDSNLSLKKIYRTGDSSNDWFKCITLTNNNKIICGGSSFDPVNNNTKGLLVQTDSAFNTITSKKFESGSRSYFEIISIVEDATTENIFSVGNYFESSNMATNEGVFIIKTDKNGNIIKSIDKRVAGIGGNYYPISFLDALIIDKKLYISGEIPMNVRKMGVFIYNETLDLLHESGFLTVGCNDKPNSLLFKDNSFFLLGKTSGSGAIDFWSDYTSNAIYDAAILKVNYNSATHIITNEFRININPNPTSAVLYINFDNSNINKFSVQIYNLTGVELSSNYFMGCSGEINVNQIRSGIYFAKILVEGKQIVVKFIKQ